MKKILSALFLIAFLLIPLSAHAALNVSDASLSNRQSDIDSLTLRVDELVKRVESAKPAGTAEEQRTQFQILHKEIDILEHEVDLLEDRYELDYLTSEIAWEEYRVLEQSLDQLDDKLDQSEDRLKRIFYRN